LNVELLRAKGQGGAADDLAFQLEQQRRLEDAQKNQSADYVAKLQELQQLQRDQRAAQQLIDSTGAAGGGGSGAAARGATQALTAVSAVVTDRTALMLVDINRSQLTTLGEIRDIIKRTNGIGGGGPQITIINHFGADVGQEIADKIIDELEEKLDARNGGRLNLQHIHTGMVGR
jgi:formate-dependent nitrite reductase cytochrome c552 subunit